MLGHRSRGGFDLELAGRTQHRDLLQLHGNEPVLDGLREVDAGAELREVELLRLDALGIHGLPQHVGGELAGQHLVIDGAAPDQRADYTSLLGILQHPVNAWIPNAASQRCALELQVHRRQSP